MQFIFVLYAVKFMDMINEFTRLEAACRRFKFEVLKAIGIFWLIRKSGMEIKQPWRRMYDRAIKQ